MKNVICCGLLLFLFFSLSGQTPEEYLSQADTYSTDTFSAVIIAPSGLKLRDKPDFKAKTLAKIPFAEKVFGLYTENDENGAMRFYDQDSIAGQWVKVHWKGQTGYAFSAYMGNNIIKMKAPVYLMYENSAWCWDDSYISMKYHYYGVYPNSDTSAFQIIEQKPLFYNNTAGLMEMGGVTFKFKNQRESMFAFASREPFNTGIIPVSGGKTTLNLEQKDPDYIANTSIPIPGTFWELKIKTVEENRNNDAPYSHNRLIIRDIKSGAWHYLTDQDMYLGEIKIDWCGDIDGDKIPDLMLTDMSDHGMGTMLFLSKNAGKWKYLKLAGVYYWGDCC